MSKQKVGLWLRRGLVVLGCLLVAALFWVVVVLLHPGENTGPQRDQTPLAPSEAHTITGLSELEGLVREFPAPALMAASGLTMEGAAAYDRPFGNGVARVLRLIYRDENDNNIQLDSITPAGALSLLEGGGYRLSGVAGHNVAGHRTVRMENSTYIRLHMQTDEGLYVITVPRESEDSLASLLRPLQLYVVN